jgi:hypothetical protein
MYCCFSLSLSLYLLNYLLFDSFAFPSC